MDYYISATSIGFTFSFLRTFPENADNVYLYLQWGAGISTLVYYAVDRELWRALINVASTMTPIQPTTWVMG